MWKIKNIYEADFGCEERQPNSKLKVLVELENESGEIKTIEAYDEYLTWNHIDVGSPWEEPDEEKKAPLIFKMEEIIDTEGTDYATFSLESKKTIAAAASTAVTIKSILDTPILTEAGFVTDESESMVKNIVTRLQRE